MNAPTALIIDDSRLTRTIIKNALAAAGYDVAGEAVNGQEGIAMTARIKPDVITVDLTMPEKGGMESLEEIRTAHPAAKVIVVTALGSQKLLQEDALKAGATAMIAKPFNPLDLARLADKLLGRRGAPSDPLGVVLPAAGPLPAGTDGLLSPEQIGDLMELGNIGAGNAASRLSDLIGQRCLISPPQVVYGTTEIILQAFPDKDYFMAALAVRLLGDVPAVMSVALKRDHAPAVLKYMTRGALGPGDMSEAARFALRQAGEFLTRAFSQAVHQFLTDQGRQSPPEIAVAGEPGDLASLLASSKGAGPLLVIHCGFSDASRNFEGKLAYILSNAAQKAVLSRLNQLLVLH
jgi:two-component system, chemotaxis family, chemotaxis protein CheY